MSQTFYIFLLNCVMKRTKEDETLMSRVDQNVFFQRGETLENVESSNILHEKSFFITREIEKIKALLASYRLITAQKHHRHNNQYENYRKGEKDGIK